MCCHQSVLSYWQYLRYPHRMRMVSALKVFAYICIWTTPFQLIFVLWGIRIVFITDFSVLSLSNMEFLRNYVDFLLPLIEWLYTWFGSSFLDWFLSLPMILHGTCKAIFSTFIGFWILKKIRSAKS